VAQAVCGGFESNDLGCCECSSYTVQRHSLCKDENSIDSRRRQHSHSKYSVRKGQNWRPTRKVLDDEDGSPTNASTANRCASGSEATDSNTGLRECDFTPQRQETLCWKPANIGDTNSFMQTAQTKATSTHQPVDIPKEEYVEISDSGRYDIAASKCWQAANCGSSLATA
jgi:hypothetical protein